MGINHADVWRKTSIIHRQKITLEIRPSEPEVDEAIENEFLMDDLSSSADSVEAAIAKQAKIHSTLLKAKFPLRKYVSNSPEFIKARDTSLVGKLRTLEFSTEVAKF